MFRREICGWVDIRSRFRVLSKAVSGHFMVSVTEFRGSYTTDLIDAFGMLTAV